ncbi:hypothetical protein CPLU01_01920 [Colletotrichum plurivorum]|uniref:Uncharacterized protein n=1 Tax=Colletotrichum plurivorum TaxID=2175906 RepID=A0A8H6KWW9_9PEZI|nr:hypothetical protein CPLU01_01920 [Colletotrichum plurivorum]
MTLQGRNGQRQWYTLLAVVLLLCWVKVLFFGSGPRADDESGTDSGSPRYPDVSKVYGGRPYGLDGGGNSKPPPKPHHSAPDFKDKLVSYLPGKGKTGHVSGKLPEYSIKPIAYIFPQFHRIPENDKFWGENFTEWTNVQKITVNNVGVETPRPAKEVGFYNLLDLSTRKRYTETIKKSSIHGVVYHHYWFGYPVMDGVIQAMLKDGHPDVPFMLNWANEPWTVRWDGSDNPSGTLLAQVYGSVEEWRRHYDWLVPFFKHPNYIRVNGKVQMMIYNPAHMGDKGKRMFDAWRLWASQDPAVGGMDVIETKLENDDPNSRGSTDAMNEFGFRSAGSWDANLWTQNWRAHRIWHRGAMVSWDNTPRHATDGGGMALVFAHPELWKRKLMDSVEMLRRIKGDPNPLGEENFFFINAFNEWGEGNTLESTTRYGNGYLGALDEAMAYADKHVAWAPHLLLESDVIAKEVARNDTQVDVCVVIRDFHTLFPWQEPWTLRQTIESLREMRNTRWRAVVAGVHSDDEKRRIDYTLLDMNEPRVVNAEVPAEVQKKIEENPNGSEATDWAIKHLDEVSPGCGRAKYLLITNATNVYEPDAFDGLDKAEADIVGMNFESLESMRLADKARPEGFSWDQRCERFGSGTTQTCHSAAADSELQDLGAVFIRMKRWRMERVELARSAAKGLGDGQLLRDLSKQASPWKWAAPAEAVTKSCHLLHAEAMTTCLRSGRLWADLPEVEPYKGGGCYSGAVLQGKFPGGKIPEQWDYARFDKDPFCMRLSQKQYDQVTGRE